MCEVPAVLGQRTCQMGVMPVPPAMKLNRRQLACSPLCSYRPRPRYVKWPSGPFACKHVEVVDQTCACRMLCAIRSAVHGHVTSISAQLGGRGE